MSAYNITEFSQLSDHLLTKKQKNMHRRHKRTVSGVSILAYFNIVRFESKDRLLGHIFGPEIDFEYEIKRTPSGATFQILRNAGSRVQALDILVKEPARMLKRIEQDKGDSPFSNYSEGEYYVKRSSSGKVSASLIEAIDAGVIPTTALKNIVAWEFTVAKGGKKRKPKKS